MLTQEKIYLIYMHYMVSFIEYFKYYLIVTIYNFIFILGKYNLKFLQLYGYWFKKYFG